MPPTSRPSGPRRPLRRPWRSPMAQLRRRPTLWWCATLALVVATAWALTGAISRVEAEADRHGATRSVLVATRDIAPGDVVDEGNAVVRELPGGAVGPGAAGGERLGGRASQPIHHGEVVHEGRLAPAGASPVTALLPPGSRGIAVPAAAGALPLQVGDVVDVLATGDALDAAGAPTVTVAAAAVVVDVGEDATTVAVPAEQAPAVAYAVAASLVTLALVPT